MTHYDDNAFSRYIFDPESYFERDALERHVEACSDCARRLAVAREVENGLRDEATWRVAASVDYRRPPDSLLKLAAQIETERAEARALLDTVVISPIIFSRAAIESDERFHTTGVVHVLCLRAEALRESQPEFALVLANTAIAIGLKLSKAGRLRKEIVLAQAWLERAAALVLIGRFRDAEKSARKAEVTFDGLSGASPHDLALVWLVRSVICAETGRLDEAQILAASAARHFLSFGDRKRYVKALLASANVLCMRNRHSDALPDLERVLTAAREVDDRLLISRTLQSLGETYAALSRFDEAVPCFLESLALSDELGAESEKMRATWSFGNILLLTGAFEEAIARLDEARRGFEALGIINDAALVRLQLAEAFLASGRHEDVPALLANVTVTFASEDMMRETNLALSYLHEALSTRGSSLQIVRHVRTYLEELRTDPTRRFVPLQ